MHKEELKIISDAHKVNVICSDAKGIYLNTDGTTMEQVALCLVSVNELPVSAIEYISREFEKLRRVAEMLGLPNANSINWTLVINI